jgi:hypothetical protein
VEGVEGIDEEPGVEGRGVVGPDGGGT